MLVLNISEERVRVVYGMVTQTLPLLRGGSARARLERSELTTRNGPNKPHPLPVRKINNTTLVRGRAL